MLICSQGAGGMKGKGFHVDVVQEHLEKEAEVGFHGQWRELGTGYSILGTGQLSCIFAPQTLKADQRQ